MGPLKCETDTYPPMLFFLTVVSLYIIPCFLLFLSPRLLLYLLLGFPLPLHLVISRQLLLAPCHRRIQAPLREVDGLPVSLFISLLSYENRSLIYPFLPSSPRHQHRHLRKNPLRSPSRHPLLFRIIPLLSQAQTVWLREVEIEESWRQEFDRGGGGVRVRLLRLLPTPSHPLPLRQPLNSRQVR